MAYRWRIIHRMFWGLLLVGMPFFANCVCISPKLDECQTTRDCTLQWGTTSYVCVSGRCMDPSGSSGSCKAGQTLRCLRSTGQIASSCRQGKRYCVAGRWSTCQIDRSQIRKEVCNGLDDDCDGRVDESFPEKNKPCVVAGALGPCGKGEIRSCSRGKLVCLATTLARPEGEGYGNCINGVDDNCNGYIDDPVHDDCDKCTGSETRKCYPWGQGLFDPTLGKGPCRVGTQTCKSGKWSPCVGAVVPKSELCGNFVDEDCDGAPDNAAKCTNKNCKPSDQRACYNGPSSTVNVGTCRSGLQVCDTVGKWGVCVGEVLPRSEICGNKLDDDCNGIVDDCNPNACTKGDTRSCYKGTPGTSGVGVCKAGKESCGDKGTWSGLCVGEQGPSKEVCGNSLDDDCNGKVDDCEVTQLVSGSWDKSNPLALWDLRTKKKIRSFSGPTDVVYAARFSPDGKSLVAVSHDKSVMAWSVDTGKSLWKATVHTGSVFGLGVDPKGKFVVTASEDKSLRVLNLSNGQEIGSATAHTAAIYCLAIDPTGRWVATGSADTTVRLWDLAKPSAPKLVQTFRGHTLGVFAVAFDPKGRWLASGGRDGTTRLWKLTGGAGPSLSYTTASVTSLAFQRQSNQMAVGSSDGSIALFDLAGTSPVAGKVLKQSKGGAIYSLAFHPNKGELTSGNYDSMIQIWSLQTGKVITSWSGHRGPISSLSYRP